MSRVMLKGKARGLDCRRPFGFYRFFPLDGRLGRCVRAEAATFFTAAGVFGFESSLLAIVATFADVPEMLIDTTALGVEEVYKRAAQFLIDCEVV
jgi:hypothetical protein